MWDALAFAFILIPPSLLALPSAQQPARDQTNAAAPSTAPAPPTGTGVVSGVVVSAETRPQPVRRVIVTLAGAELPIGRSAITDDNGRFSIDQLPAGRFTLSATKPAYLPAAYGAARPGRPGIALNLASGQRLSNLTITIAHGAAIGGTVRDAKGRPAAGVQVQAVRALPGGSFAAAPITTYADDRGQYRFFGLVPGDYVVASSVGTGISMLTGEVGAMSSADVDAIFAALDRRQPAPGPLASSTATMVPAVRTMNPAPVFYPGVLNAAQAVKVTVATGEDRGGTDIALQVARTAAVEGTIVSPSGTVPNLSLAMTQNGPDVPIVVGLPTLKLRPGADGRFRFTGANPGSYTIQARTAAAPQGRAGGSVDAGGPMMWARAEVDVNGDDLSGVTLVLQPALHLPGRVVFDGTTLAPPADLTKLRVVASSATDTAMRRMVEVGLAVANSLPATAPVAADGTFDLGLEPGSHTISVSPAPAGWWLRSAMVGGRDVLDAPLEAGPNAATLPQTVLTFSDRHTMLSGTLRTGAAQAAPSYFIVVFPADRTLWRPQARRIKATRAGTDGAFVVRDLPPGDYLIAALSDFESDDLLDPTFFEKLVPSAAKVTLGEGEQKTQDLRIGG